MPTNEKNPADNPRASQIAHALGLCAREIAVTVTTSLNTCMSCEHFDEASETCALARARPPARVIAYGCPQYLPDIPF